MLFRRAVAIDWNHVQNIRASQAKASNVKENKSRLNKQYTVGEKLLIVLDADERCDKPKLDKPTKGPFMITKVFENGTVEINRGRYTEICYNIRILRTCNYVFFTEPLYLRGKIK